MEVITIDSEIFLKLKTRDINTARRIEHKLLTMGVSWLDGEYPCFEISHNAAEENTIFIKHNLRQALQILYIPICTYTGSIKTEVYYLDENTYSQIYTDLINKYIVIPCEQKRACDYDESQIQYPVYQIVLYEASNIFFMELMAHNCYEGQKVIAALNEYYAQDQQRLPTPLLFTWKPVSFRCGKYQKTSGIIKIGGDLNCAINFLEKIKLTQKHIRIACGALPSDPISSTVIVSNPENNTVIKNGLFNPHSLDLLREEVKKLSAQQLIPRIDFT